MKRFGKLQLAHLNAGIAATSNVLDTTLEEWNRTIAINLSGVFYGLQASARAIRDAGGGSIVITSSDAGLRGGGGMGTLLRDQARRARPHEVRDRPTCRRTRSA